MNNEARIEKYLLEEKQAFGVVFVKLFSKITKYEDIAKEFCRWLEVRNYDYDNQIEIGGYSAKKIYEMAPILDGIGVYNFLVTLRDNPEEAARIINEGFK